MKEYRKILLVDDDEASLFINRKMLLHFNISKCIDAVSSGLAALEYLRECQRNACLPDLIVLDVMMPHMDGFTFLDQCKVRGYLPESVKVVMLSSSPDESDKEEAWQRGISDYFIKPINKEDIQTLFAE